MPHGIKWCLTQRLEQLVKYAKQFGLKVNVPKTKTFEGESIEEVGGVDDVDDANSI